MTDRDRLIELLKIPIHPKENVDPAEVVADYLIDNGVIVPPCKVGDTVYVLWREIGRQKKIRPVKVYALRWDEKKHKFRVCVEGSLEVTAYGGKYTDYYRATFNWDKFGKTVFLTKEEAEAALQKRCEKDVNL